MTRTFWNTRLERIERRLHGKKNALPSNSAEQLRNDPRLDMGIPALAEECRIEQEFLALHPELGDLPHAEFVKRLRASDGFSTRYEAIQREMVPQIHAFMESLSADTE